MNAERLHAVAADVLRDFEQTSVVATLRDLSSSLRNQVNTPQEPSHQQETSTQTQRLRTALQGAPSNDFDPVVREAADQIGVSEVLGNRLLQRVDSVLRENGITIAVAADQVSVIADEVETVFQQLQALVNGLQAFGIGREELEPGAAEVAILIPRREVSEELARLGREFADLQTTLAPFRELATGKFEPFRVSSISSSEFNVLVDVDIQTAAWIAGAVSFVVKTYKDILDIKLKRAELRELSVPESALAGLEEHANHSMQQNIDEYVRGAIESVTVEISDTRMHELRTSLTVSMNRIANKVDRHFSFDVRVQPSEPVLDDEEPEPEHETEREAVARIREAAVDLRYVSTSDVPILRLPEGDLAGGHSVQGVA